jgi:hypothetical protein
MFPIHAVLTIGGKMSPELVDQTILACCKPQFLKVARIIGDVERILRDVPEPVEKPTRTRVDFIVDRIKALVKAERLESAGNLDRWGNSEIRLTRK